MVANFTRTVDIERSKQIQLHRIIVLSLNTQINEHIYNIRKRISTTRNTVCQLTPSAEQKILIYG